MVPGRLGAEHREAAGGRRRVTGCTRRRVTSGHAVRHDRRTHRSAHASPRAGVAADWLDYHRATLELKCEGLRSGGPHRPPGRRPRCSASRASCATWPRWSGTGSGGCWPARTPRRSSTTTSTPTATSSWSTTRDWADGSRDLGGGVRPRPRRVEARPRRSTSPGTPAGSAGRPALDHGPHDRGVRPPQRPRRPASASWSTARWATDVELSEAMRTPAAAPSLHDRAGGRCNGREPSSTTRASPRVGRTARAGTWSWSKDPALRRRLAELMAPVWSEYVAQVRLGETAFSAVSADRGRPGGGPAPPRAQPAARRHRARSRSCWSSPSTCGRWP